MIYQPGDETSSNELWLRCLCVWRREKGFCNRETNISAEKAGPLKRLNDHANGFLAEEEGREAKSPETDRVNF